MAACQLALGVCAALVLAISAAPFASAAVNDTDYTLAFETRTDDRNSLLESAASARYNTSTAALALNRITLGPCAVRTAHIHPRADELYVAVEGQVGVSLALPNGTSVSAVLAASESFVIPQGWAHTVFNPDCTLKAVTLSFFNSATPGTNNAVTALYTLTGAPFKPYADVTNTDSLEAALGPLAFDPTCLTRCSLDSQFGQAPV